MEKRKAPKILIARHCWWCGRSSEHPNMTVLIEGQQHIHICGDCVGVCVELLEKGGFSVQRVALPQAVDAVDPGGETVTG